jgi:type 1 glutamine amidotransferase
MQNVPAKFNIVDELYRWEKDPEGTEIEVLAIGRSLKTGEEYPVIWTVQHPNAKIVCNTLGHDAKAHDLAAYKTMLSNSMTWVKAQPNL